MGSPIVVIIGPSEWGGEGDEKNGDANERWVGEVVWSWPTDIMCLLGWASRQV